VIEQLGREEQWSVQLVCRVLGVSRSGYYAWLAEVECRRARRERELSVTVRQIFWHHKRRYGARRIAEEMKCRGQACGVARVARLLKDQGLKAIQPRSFRPRTTESQHGLGYSPNLLRDSGAPTGINEVWVADITYIPLRTGGFGYLALVLDLYSRRIVGWHFEEEMEESLVLSALGAALRARQPRPGLIHHSDRGGQYAGRRFRGVLRRAGMRQSMSRAGNCYDNAFLESCFGTIKTELELDEYEDAREARRELGEYIAYYNVERRHSSLGYVAPHEFENQ
jgi:transposase InsO family protein